MRLIPLLPPMRLLFPNISELEKDEEYVPHVEDVKEICDDDLVEENPKEAPFLSLEDDEFIEDFVAEENDDEEPSHASTGNQDTFEDQVCEEDLDDK
jgi:hypothetical protein